MNARVAKYHPFHRKLYAAGVFTLALLILVVTCPLKRMMQGGAPGSAVQKFSRSTVHPSAATYATATSCCALKNKEPLIQSSVIKLGGPSPAGIVPYLVVVQGFAIHYFLSTVDNTALSYLPTPSLSLPLFLQHLRLRI